MKSFLNRWRGASNIFGTVTTLTVLLLFLFSPLFLLLENNSYFFIVLGVSIFFNYLITAAVAVELVSSNTKGDLFINFYLFIFLLVPFLGIFFYFLFGFDSIHVDNSDKYSKIYDRYRKHEDNSVNDKYLSKKVDDSVWKSFSFNQIKHKFSLYLNANLEILYDPKHTLREITEMIEKAKKFIHMEFYLFCDGLVFEHIFKLFEKKIKEGVEIRLIIDYVGNIGRLKNKSIKRLKDLGVQVRIFNPLFRSNNLWWQFRNHNKTLIIDNDYALFGSTNIADEYFNIANKYFQTTELSVKLSGSIVSSVTSVFLVHWELCDKNRWDVSEFSEEKSLDFFKRYVDVENKNDNFSVSTIAQFLDNSPVRNEQVIKDNLIQLIFNAKKSIVISTPYFFPSKDLINALKQAGILGVSVKVLVPKNPDLFNFFRTLNRQLFAELLEHNIEIYEYFGFNHEKLMIVDGEVGYVGTYNWDYRALYLNFESAILVKCKNFVENLNKFMDKQFKNSHKVVSSDLKVSKNLVCILFGLFIRIFKPFL